jgi:hypothetical protein
MTGFLGMMALLLAAGASAVRTESKFATLDDEAANFARLSLSQYVTLLQEALHNTGPRSADHPALLGHIEYYQSLQQAAGMVNQTVRDRENGTCHDCLPFELQPALFKASAETVTSARAAWLRATNGGKMSSEAVCGAGTVPIARPVVKYNGGVVPRLALRPDEAALQDEVSLGGAPQSTTKAVQVCSSSAGVVLGVGCGVKSELPKDTPAGASVTNMMRWATAYGGMTETFGTGWSHSSSGSIKGMTSIFVTLSINGNSPTWNSGSGFIGYPGAPPLGSAVGDVQYMFTFETQAPHITPIYGYELYVTPFKGYSFGSKIAVGYWKAPTTGIAPEPYYVSVAASANGMQAAGKVFGWACNGNRQSMNGAFSNPGGNFNITYGSAPNFPAGSAGITGNNWVNFGGSN